MFNNSPIKQVKQSIGWLGFSIKAESDLMQWTMGQSISFILILLIRFVGLCIHFGKLQSQFSSEPILCIVNTNPITFNKANVSIQKYYICTGIEVTRYWSSLSSFPTKKIEAPMFKKKIQVKYNKWPCNQRQREHVRSPPKTNRWEHKHLFHFLHPLYLQLHLRKKRQQKRKKSIRLQILAAEFFWVHD